MSTTKFLSAILNCSGYNTVNPIISRKFKANLERVAGNEIIGDLEFTFFIKDFNKSFTFSSGLDPKFKL